LQRFIKHVGSAIGWPINFTNQHQEVNWKYSFLLLSQFHQEHGHCEVTDKNLKVWAENQRLGYQIHQHKAATAKLKLRVGLNLDDE
jgi:Helicase associated domain